MQDALNFSTTTRNPLFPFSHPKSPAFSTAVPHLKPPILPSLSAKSTTTSAAPLPLKPPKTPISTSTPTPLPLISTPDPDRDFHSKALFLDSIGLDSLSLLSHHHSAASIAAASLPDLRSLFEYLASFELSRRDLRRIAAMCPDILSLRHRDVAAVFSFLLREAHVPSAHLRRVICRRPRLLASPVDTRLRPTMYFLQSIGIHEVNKHTHLLSCSVEDKFMPKIEYFQKVGFGYRDSISMFRRFPPLFCYSVKENFEPKFNYFVVEMGRDLKELKEFPQYFSFSLERRIKPRHQCCLENGVCFPLPVMLKMKEEEFRRRLDVCCDSSMPRSSSPLWCANHCDVSTV